MPLDKWLMEVLTENKDKDFVQRILRPQDYPVINNPNGSYSTHLMAWGEAGDGKYAVYPTIFYDGKKLKKMDPKKAFNYAKKKGDYIIFDSPRKADWFSKNYKRYWTSPEHTSGANTIP